MINRVFVLMLLGLGLAKLPAAELEIWNRLDIWPDKVPSEKGVCSFGNPDHTQAPRRYYSQI